MARVKKVTEPPTPIDIASRSVIDPTLAKLKHLINVPGLGFVKKLCEGYHATARTSIHERGTISLLPIAMLKHGP